MLVGNYPQPIVTPRTQISSQKGITSKVHINIIMVIVFNERVSESCAVNNQDPLPLALKLKFNLKA